MTKYTIQDQSEEKSDLIFRLALDPRWFSINSFGPKDKYPDIDGHIRLRDGNGFYLEKYLHYQLKGVSRLRNKKYSCDAEIIKHLLETNVPTLLFVVDITDQKVYWFYLDRRTASRLEIKADGKGRTLDLTNKEVTPANSSELNHFWSPFAKRDNYHELSDSLNKISHEFDINLLKCLGLLYLLVRVKKETLPKIFESVLRIPVDEAKVVIRKLTEQGIITETQNLLLVDNDQIGTDAVFELLPDLKFSTLESIITDESERKLVIGRLAKIRHSKTDNYFENNSKQILTYLENPMSNEETNSYLELLKKYCFRVPKESLQIVGKIINSPKPLPPKAQHVDGIGNIAGKSHVGLIISCLDILENLRYLRMDGVFKLLLGLTKSDEQAVKSRTVEILRKLSEFDLFVLQKIGYEPQVLLLNEIERWGVSNLEGHMDTIIEIGKEVLKSSFEGQSMSDYKTVTLQFGPLVPSNNLKLIRKRMINILERLFYLTDSVGEKKRILEVMNGASQTPHQGNYGEDLVEMVLEDVNYLVDFFTKILPDSDFPIVQNIEEFSNRYLKRFSADQIKGLSELRSLIENNNEYSIFRTLVGHNYKFSDDWREADKERKTKLDEFVGSFNDEKFAIWERRIVDIATKNSDSEPSAFQYFYMLLNELGKRKPKLALKLLTQNEKELQPFLIHLLNGLWESDLHKETKSLVENWIATGKNLTIIAALFIQIKPDLEILTGIFEQAKRNPGERVFINLIGVCTTHYERSNQLKSIFIGSVQELTKLDSTSWVNYSWFRSLSIIKSLTEQEVEVILTNLLKAKNVDYNVEEVLAPIAKLYVEKVIDFFHSRVNIYKSFDDRLASRYDAVPYQFNELQDTLAEKAEIVIPGVLSWYSEEDWLFKYEASQLLKNIFPEFNKRLESDLLKMIERDGDQNARAVLAVLHDYDGEKFSYPVCKAFVKKFIGKNKPPKNQNYKADLFLILSSTGTVMGEYGFVEAYENKLSQIQTWKQERDKSILNFVTDYERWIKNRIDFEKKQADEMVVLMKKRIDD